MIVSARVLLPAALAVAAAGAVAQPAQFSNTVRAAMVFDGSP